MSDPGMAVTEGSLFGGRLLLRQPARGHRAGTDAVLVAAAAGPVAGDRILDAGSGVGTIGLALALQEPAAAVTLLEREPVLAALARDNVALNALGDRVRVEEADLFEGSAVRGMTLAVSNPPFYAAGSGQAAPDPLKRRAHQLESADEGDWLGAMLRWLAPHGRLVLIQRPEALPALIAAANGRLGGIRIRAILPREGVDAIRVLFGGIVGSRAPPSIAAPLVLHAEGGAFTTTSAAIHAGETLSPLFSRPTRRSRPQGPAPNGAQST